MRFFRPTPVRIQAYFGYRSRSRLVLRARALRSAAGTFSGEQKPRGKLPALRVMFAQFASREVAGVRVTLRIEGPDGVLLQAEAVSDAEGYVRFDCALEPDWALPEHPAWETADLTWANAEGPQTVPAYILAPGLDSRMAVISDIDDTIIETGITGGLRSLARNWRRVLAQMPDERVAVPGANAFYGALGGGPVPHAGERRAAKPVTATHRPFFYVSSSPWNLFSYLVAFQRTKKLPLGPLLLRDWGLNRKTFGSSSHGAHKAAAIDGILAMYPELRFALIGDDTQGDLPAFADVVRRFEGRIAAVFVRTAAGEALTAEEQAGVEAIRAAGVSLWLGDSFAVGEDFLHSLGFTADGETEQIVKAVEKVDSDAPLA